MSVKVQGSSGNVADVDSSGNLKTTSTLPSGASTEATLAAIKAKTDNLDVLLSTRTKPADTQNVNIVSGLELEIKNDSGNPLAVSATSLPLPTGAATSAKQDTLQTALDSINTKTPTLVTGRQPVDGSGVTQPVSQVSQPLPTGASSAANQATEIASLASIDGKTPTLVGGRQPVDGSGVTQPVSASSLPLPTGASTESTLAAIKAKTDNIDVLLSTRTKPADIQNIAGTVTSRGSDFQTLTGVYYYAAGAFLVNAAADSATAGRCWLINPVGSGLTVRIKVIQFSSNMGSALAAPTSPRITVERITFTGTASGAIVSPAKRKTLDATNIGSLRTASTGLALAAGNMICSFLPIASATAVGYTSSSIERFEPEIEDRIELEPGEGIVIRQADAGTTADTRRYTIDIITQEF